MDGEEGIRTLRGYQSGAVIMLFMLILVAGASYVLIRKLNANLFQGDPGAVNMESMREAKYALLGWSVQHPDNPGMLPYPDRNSDRNGYDGRSDCTSGSINPDLLLGKLPWQGQDTPCVNPKTGLGIRPTDFYGEVLWYAVSENLVYANPGRYPFTSLDILDKTDGWITVRDRTGGVISDRVAFVIIAPGVALSGQDRSTAAPDSEHFLDSVTIEGVDYSNADRDQDFILYPDSDETPDTTDSFNDQLIFVTIDELIHLVEKRATGELANLLTRYHTETDTVPGKRAFPWLRPFADPKADVRRLHGTHTRGNNQSVLRDTRKDFFEWGVRRGDIVWNLTDGSYGIVDRVMESSHGRYDTLIFDGGMELGEENRFDRNDHYYIDIKATLAVAGTARSGSDGSTLEDTNKDFQTLGIRVGDVLENVGDGSSGLVTTVTATRLSVDSLRGGVDNTFRDGDAYRIRAGIGIVGADTDANPLTLEDNSVNFTVMGVRTGDLLRNVSDGAYGRISAVEQGRLTVSELRHGQDNTFSAGDRYELPRFDVAMNAAISTRRGLLAFHESGGAFRTGFDMDWQLGGAYGNEVCIGVDADAGSNFCTISSNASRERYFNGLTNAVESSINPGSFGTLSVPETAGQCIWITKDIGNCSGVSVMAGVLSGGATAANATFFYDATRNFKKSGVGSGDKIENLNNGSAGLVVSAFDGDRIRYVSIAGKEAFMISPGDQYRIRIASSRTDELTADPLTNPDEYRVYNSTGRITASVWNAIEIGDAVENQDTGGVGLITNKGMDINGHWFDYTALRGGSRDDIAGGDKYRISFNYVERREYEVSVRISSKNGGGSDESFSDGVRRRSVCLGYGSDCSDDPGYDTTLRQHDTVAPTTVTIRDYDDKNILIGRAKTVIRSGATGRLRLANILYMLSVGDDDDDDIPGWFVRNGWHRYFYIAYSAGGDIPGTASICMAASDCLQLKMTPPAEGLEQANIRALIVYSGRVLANTPSPRTSGEFEAYYEGDNANDDDEFDKRAFAYNAAGDPIDFNDRVKVATSCSAVGTELCWR